MYICPVSKKGELSFVSNYRPLFGLNVESKIFEAIVFKYLITISALIYLHSCLLALLLTVWFNAERLNISLGT